MRFIGKNENEILLIKVKEDMPSFELKYTLNEEPKSTIISNKGVYSIYLGRHYLLIIDNYKNINYQFVKEVNYDGFFSKFNPLSLTEDEYIPVERNKEYLFSDLKVNNGANLYNSLKRLLNILSFFLKTKNEEYLSEIKYSLDFLFNNWYTAKANYEGNWWFYEIGAPRAINEILILLRDYLDVELINKYLNIERFYLPFANIIFYRRNFPNIYREEALYANLADNIYICSLRAILQNNNKELDHLFNLIGNVLKTTKYKDGFYSDGGFIQHVNVPYNASYGEVLINSLAKVLNIFYLLDYDCSKYISKIEKILFKSYLPFLYNNQAIESVRGRAISRYEQDLKYSFKMIINAVERLYTIFPTIKLKSFLDIIRSNEYLPTAKSFNSIDRFIFYNNDYYISLNLNSKYISNFESINGENLLGYYQSNNTYDIYYKNNENKLSELNTNYLYRNGSTNSYDKEEANSVNSNLASGVDLDNMLIASFIQNTDVYGEFSRIILPNSIIFVGSNIASSKEYISTICNYDSDFKQNGNEIFIKEKKIIVRNSFKLKQFNETFNYKDYNLNNPEKSEAKIMNRIFMENPSDYHYQIYPKYKDIDDKYALIKLNNAHVVIYKNYLFISSFTDEINNYLNLKFKGFFSAILKYNKDKLLIKLVNGKKEESEIYLEDLNYQFNNNIVLKDEQIKKIISKRR